MLLAVLLAPDFLTPVFFPAHFTVLPLPVTAGTVRRAEFICAAATFHPDDRVLPDQHGPSHGRLGGNDDDGSESKAKKRFHFAFS